MEAQYVHWILWIVLCIAGVAVLEMMGFSIIEKTHAIMKSLSGFSEKTDTPEERGTHPFEALYPPYPGGWDPEIVDSRCKAAEKGAGGLG